MEREALKQVRRQLEDRLRKDESLLLKVLSYLEGIGVKFTPKEEK
jgi:DUF1009 family protein